MSNLNRDYVLNLIDRVLTRGESTEVLEFALREASRILNEPPPHPQVTTALFPEPTPEVLREISLALGPDKRIPAIKLVRRIYNLGLRKAKDLVESTRTDLNWSWT